MKENLKPQSLLFSEHPNSFWCKALCIIDGIIDIGSRRRWFLRLESVTVNIIRFVIKYSPKSKKKNQKYRIVL